MYKFIKQQKGFTLVELIAVVAIMGVLMISIVGVFMFGVNLYNTANDSYMARTTAQIVLQKIQNDITYAQSVTVNSTNTPDASKVTGTNYLYSSGGSLILKNGSTISDTFPSGSMAASYGCSVTFDVSSTKSVDIIININKGSSTIYSINTSIYIVGLEGASNGAIVDNTGSSVGTEIDYQ